MSRRASSSALTDLRVRASSLVRTPAAMNCSGRKPRDEDSPRSRRALRDGEPSRARCEGSPSTWSRSLWVESKRLIQHVRLCLSGSATAERAEEPAQDPAEESAQSQVESDRTQRHCDAENVEGDPTELKMEDLALWRRLLRRDRSGGRRLSRASDGDVRDGKGHGSIYDRRGGSERIRHGSV